MKYSLVYFDTFPEGYWAIKALDDNGVIYGIPIDEANADYQQYLIDTDGGLSTE
jgi:hypothetical protein